MVIGAMAGVSALWQLFGGGGTASSPDTTTVQTSASTSEPSADPGTVTSSPQTKLASDLKSLLLHLQSASGSATETDNTAQVADDLRNVFGDVHRGGHRHHGHHGQAAGGTQDPVQNLASALTAYAKQIGIGSASSSTGTALSA